MSDDRAHVDHVRQLLAAAGGWNRRSRGALFAWARAQGIEGPRLEALLVKALAVRVPTEGAPAANASSPSARAPGATPHARWWLALVAVAGLAASALLLARLSPRIDAGRAPAPATVSTPAPAAVETARTLPPAPVSFPKPPQIAAPSTDATVASTPALGARPAGELPRASIKAWGEAFAAAAVLWPAMPASDRQSALVALGGWLAPSASADLEALRGCQREALTRMTPRQRTLARAFETMLAAQVAGSPGVSSSVASDAAFAQAGRFDAEHALEAWAAAELPGLVNDLAAPDARDRWAGWLEAVGAIGSSQVRTALAVRAIDGLLRGVARLDGQGLAADALGSLLAGLPPRPDRPDFDAVRDAWVGWLRDGGIPSPRLWALGGIWRSGGDPPDAWLLPGERDGPQARAALADRWSRLKGEPAVPAWQPLLAQLGRPVPRSTDVRLDARIDDLTARVRLARLAESPEAGAAAALAPTADTAEPPPAPARWSRLLADPVSDTRQRTLREIRAEAPESLAPADAVALANRALGAQSKEERVLAQEIIRGALAESRAMRQALAGEVALCADPRTSADFLERLLATDLPADDASALRAAALSLLLRAGCDAGDAAAASQAMRRLTAEMRAWSADGLAGAEPVDPAAIAWQLATREAEAAASLHAPPETRPLVHGMPDRVRRLARLAPEGPRGFAAALALLCDARATRLSVQRATIAEGLRRIADGASAARSRAPDALQQAAASLEAIAAMQLLAQGAPVPVPAVEPPPAPASEASRATALAELDRAETMLAAAADDGRRLTGVLRHATSLDPSVAGRAALALAQAAPDAARRSRLLEAAMLLGDGAALEPPTRADAAEGIALAQLLAWSERGQTERLTAGKLPERVRPAAERFAAASGSSLDACLACLRLSGAPERARLADRLRLAALRTLDAPSAGWLGAIAANASGPVPEGDAAQPWRFTFPGD